MEENRVHKRVVIHIEVWRGEDGIFTRGNERLSNLSVAGAFIQSAGTTTGSILNLRFRLPGSDDFITTTASPGIHATAVSVSSFSTCHRTTWSDWRRSSTRTRDPGKPW